MKAFIPTEHQEHLALLTWASLQAGRFPELPNICTIANGGKRSKVTAALLKAEGVKRGVPDIHLLVGRGGYLSRSSFSPITATPRLGSATPAMAMSRRRI
jgi:hypothetical protein